MVSHNIRVGYPCINRSIGCRTDSRFILRNFSKERFVSITKSNLECLLKVLNFNVENEIFFFRISSDTIPFASHPILRYNWRKIFKDLLKEIGRFIKANNIRISMHPDHFVVLNSSDKRVLENSISELIYHCQFLDELELDYTAKVQIHVGGIYNNKNESIKRFIQNYKALSKNIKERLVIENDEIKYSIADCLKIHEQTGIPVVFDILHHRILNNGEDTYEAIKTCFKTWNISDGSPIVDYSEQEKEAKIGKHSNTLNPENFRSFIDKLKSLKFDIMLELKDKEKSAIKAIKIIKEIF